MLILPGRDAAEPVPFSVDLYTGTGAAGNVVQTGYDMLFNGGVVLTKNLNSADLTLLWSITGPAWYGILTDTDFLGANTYIEGDPAGFRTAGPSQAGFNDAGQDFVAWSMLPEAGFFTQLLITHSLSTQPHDLTTTPGAMMVFGGQGGNTGAGLFWHRSAAGQLGRIDQPAAFAPSTAISNVTDTSFDTAAPFDQFGTWRGLIFGHDETDDGKVFCGSFFGAATVDVALPWRPQWLMIKSKSTGNWCVFDDKRPVGYALRLNSTSAQVSGHPLQLVQSGFQIGSAHADINQNGQEHFFIAVRK